MQAQTFHQVFDQLPDPALLKTEDGWLFNPPALRLGLSENDLVQLGQWGADASLWIARRFFHVSCAQVDGQLLLILRSDVFLTAAAENVASQLRQRLQTAFGCISDLGGMDVMERDSRARDRLSGINQELYQLLRMAQQLELSGQPEAAFCRMDYVDLAAVFLSMADEVEALCAQAGVQLKLELEADDLLVMADAEKISYLVLSLISNALVHLPSPGGQITLGLKKQNGQAVITVADNGGGFSPDLLANPLWNEPERLVFGRGLGLGLPLVQRIAAAHEGTVMAFPSPKGSRVTVSIPAHTPDDLFAEPKRMVQSPGGFSMAKVLLSNALPRQVYFPDPDGDEE